MADPAAIPAAPAEPAAPAAPVAEPAAPAAPAAPAVEPVAPASLVDPSAAPAAPAAPAEPASLVPAEPAVDPKWYLADGVGGEGEAPDFFKSDKYANMFEQAKAYPELEQRFGAFTGAPEDGVYKINMPEDVEGGFDTDNQIFQDLNKWSSESQLSQEAYDSLIGMFARYEASVLPDMGEIKKGLGENADVRLSSASQWAKSNLSEDDYKSFREAQTGANAGTVFKAMEAIIAKTRQVAMPGPGDDVPGAIPTGLEEINAMQAKLGEDGKRKFETDPAYRKMVEEKRFALFAAMKK